MRYNKKQQAVFLLKNWHVAQKIREKQAIVSLVALGC
jgi:hypothetical protein